MAETDNNDYRRSRSDELKRKGLFTCLWILVLLVILMVFLIKRETIKANLISTGFFEKLFGKTPAFLEQAAARKEAELLELPVAGKGAERVGTPEFPKAEKPGGAVSVRIEPGGAEMPPAHAAEPIQPVRADEPDGSSGEAATPAAEEKPRSASRSARLCFVRVDPNGTVSRQEVSRTVLKNDSPLTTDMNLLIQGPDAAEKVLGCRSLIPEGTRLLGASVKDRTAFLDFSEEFMFNPDGTEGLLAQLMQVVYTATEFSTVDNVQILIGGVKQNYLGLEGVWIGSPLSRTSFK